jgi:hypothetical protein
LTVAVPATADKTVRDITRATGLPPAAAAALIETALGQLEDQAEWSFLVAVGQRLITLTPDFDPRNYGCAKLITLIEKIDAFDVRQDCLKVFVRPRGMPRSSPPAHCSAGLTAIPKIGRTGDKKAAIIKPDEQAGTANRGPDPAQGRDER